MSLKNLAKAFTEVFAFGVAMRHTDQDAACVMLMHKHALGEVLAALMEERGTLEYVTVGEITRRLMTRIPITGGLDG